MESTINRFATSHPFQSFGSTQHSVLLQFAQDEDLKKQNEGIRDVNFTNDRSVTLPQQESLTLIQNEGFQENSLSHPSQQAKIVPVPSQTSDKNVIAEPQPLTELRLFDGYSTSKEALRFARERKNGYPKVESEDYDRDSHQDSAEELEVPKVDLDFPLDQHEERPDLDARNTVKLGAGHFEGDVEKDQESYYGIPSDNAGHLESDFSDESSRGSTRVSPNNELGVSSETNLEIGEASAMHFENYMLSSVLENLEENVEELSTCNDISTPFHIQTIEDPVAITEPSPTAAGTKETFQEEAIYALHGGYHGGMYERGEHPANKKRKLMTEVGDCSERQRNQLIPTGGYGIAASDVLLPSNGAEVHYPISLNKFALPAEGYETNETNNSPQNYAAERDFFGGIEKAYSLAGEYGLAANDGDPPEYGATRAAETNFGYDILGQRYFSHEQYRASIIMESYPGTSNREPNDEVNQSSIDNTQFSPFVPPVPQAQTQMPSGHNPECDSILPSIEFDIGDGNNTAEQLSELPVNQENLRLLAGKSFARQDPDPWGTSLDTHAPYSRIQFASSLRKGNEAEFRNAWTDQQIEEDPDSATKFFDSIPVAEDTHVNQWARGWNDTLETEGKAAIDGQIIDNTILLQMPDPVPKQLEPRNFYFGYYRKPPKLNRPRRLSLTSVRSPDPYSPPRETGPEIPKYDFSNGQVPTLPPDFNTAQEIKRRLVAKYAIVPPDKVKRCSWCGYLGHDCRWQGCPAGVCRLCNKEGHGRKFCREAKIVHRWRDRSGKQYDAKRKETQKDKAKKKQLATIGSGHQQGVRKRSHDKKLGLEEPTENKIAERYSQEGLSSPRSLLIKRQKLADETPARINEACIRAAPVSNITSEHNIASTSKDC